MMMCSTIGKSSCTVIDLQQCFMLSYLPIADKMGKLLHRSQLYSFSCCDLVLNVETLSWALSGVDISFWTMLGIDMVIQACLGIEKDWTFFTLVGICWNDSMNTCFMSFQNKWIANFFPTFFTIHTLMNQWLVIW